jgi:A/G-specific adenine glycosylase
MDSRRQSAWPDPPSARRIRQQLLRWYERNRRDLPWRQDRDPYRVWISEIMLQQTRVAAVIEHYRKFLERFPDVRKLAKARPTSVLAAWSGLGYYRRARLLHATARMVARQGGKFPTRAAEWAELPGIGRYTANAIASIAFGEPVAVVDGNVERVLQRMSGGELSSAQLWDTAERLLARKRAGDFNQAMMELGATVCLPRQPLCGLCPLREWCASQGEKGARRKEIRGKKEICYGLDCRDEAVYLVQRPKHASLMAGMWELPEVEGRNGAESFQLRHSITVTDYQVRVVRAQVADGKGRWVARSRAAKLPLTGLARKILKKAAVI